MNINKLKRKLYEIHNNLVAERRKIEKIAPFARVLNPALERIREELGHIHDIKTDGIYCGLECPFLFGRENEQGFDCGYGQALDYDDLPIAKCLDK